MAEYIDKKELRFCEITEAVLGPHNFPILKHKRVDDIPAADVRENVHGEWVSHNLENGNMSIDKDTCSVCGKIFDEITRNGGENYNFCPNCGASMEKERRNIMNPEQIIESAPEHYRELLAEVKYSDMPEQTKKKIKEIILDYAERQKG